MEAAFNKNEPSIISKYILDVAQSFNKYYGNVRILREQRKRQQNPLVYAVTVVLKEGLRLLGVEAPEEM